MSCISVLKAKGLRLTPQRRLIVDIIHTEGHHTAEDIIAFVKSNMPGVNKSTIYRTLDVLEETGCVYKSQSGDHAIYHPAEEGRHHHLICRKCGKTVECREDLFSPFEKSLTEQYGFHGDFHHMVINGICDSCSKK